MNWWDIVGLVLGVGGLGATKYCGLRDSTP